MMVTPRLRRVLREESIEFRSDIFMMPEHRIDTAFVDELSEECVVGSDDHELLTASKIARHSGRSVSTRRARR